MEKLLRKASRIAMAVFMFCSLFLFNVAQINAHEGARDWDDDDYNHFIYSSESSDDITAYYSLDNGGLVELKKGDTLRVDEDKYEDKKIIFYVSLPKGSSEMEVEDKHADDKWELSYPWNIFKAKSYESIRDNYNPVAIDAKEKGCLYQFDYTIDDDRHDDDEWTEFKINAKAPVKYSVTYYMSDKEESIILNLDSNQYEAGAKFKTKGVVDVPHDNTHVLIGWTTDKDLVKNDQNVVNNDEQKDVMLSEKFMKLDTFYPINENIKLYAIWGREDNLSVEGYENVYDGNLHGPTITGMDNDKKYTVTYSEDGKKYSTTPLEYKDVGNYKVYVKISRNKKEILTTFVNIIITKRNLVITANSSEKPYDGKPLKAEGYTLSKGEFVDGEGFKTVTIEGSQTLPGESYNKIIGYTFNEKTNKGNYNVDKVSGTLKVTDRAEKIAITVTPNSDKVTYDGKEHTVSGIKVDGLNEGLFTLDGLKANLKKTDAGTYPVEVTGTAIIKDKKGNDVTEQFKVTKKEGKLVIEKRNLVITTEGATKEYDGKALTNKNYKVSDDGFVEGEGFDTEKTKTTGSQTLVGESKNTIHYEFDESTTKPGNYKVDVKPGTLKVTDRAEKIAITVTPNSDKVTYDGKEHTVSGFKVEGLSEDLFTLSELTAKRTETDAETYPVEVTGTAIIKDKKGNDVTEQFKVTKKEGTLEIEKAKVTITVADETKPFGTEDPKFTAKVEGEVEGDEISYTLKREDGEALGTYAITATTEEHKNYTFEVKDGTLTIITNTTALTASADDVAEVYNGDEYSVKVNASLEDATIAYADEDGNYTLTEAPVFTDAGTYTVKYQVSKEGYAPVEGSATVVITQAEVTISANDATKVEGSGDPDLTAVLGELFKDDTIEYTVVREAGETVGTYTINVEVQEHKNYKVLVEAGVFTITAAPVTPTPIPPVTPTPIPPVGPDTPTPIVTPTTPPVVTPPVVTPPVVTPDAPIVTPDAPVVEEVVDPETPKAEGNEKVESNKTPKSSGNENSWALVNLISAAGTLLLGMILLLSKTNKEEEEEENVNAYKRSKLMKVISSLVAIFTVVLFFLTENMRLAMTFIDKWTIVMVVLLVVQVVIYFMARRWKEIDTDEDTVEAK